MADPIGTFSGISSGIQWRDMVDQIMAIETQRRLNPLTARQTALNAQADVWKQFQTIVRQFRDAAAALKRAAAFDVFSASASKSASTGRDIVSATAGAGAAPGSYAVEVLATARAQKLGGAFVPTSTSALGVTGSFAVNGRVVSITALDTLATVRDKINAVNAGAQASGVSATIVSAGAGSRLVLSADATGAAGIDLTDDGAGTLTALGFSDGTVVSNFDATGAAQTHRFSSAGSAVGTLVPLSPVAATTIRVGGFAIDIDVSIDSLTSIADKINAASGNPASARVVTSSDGGRTTHRLVTDLTVDVDPLAVPGDSARTLALLGFTTAGRSDVAQSVVSANTFTDAATGLAATAATLLTDLQVNGQSLGVVAGDSFRAGGARGDGSSAAGTLVVGPGTTLGDLMGTINDATTGFGAGTRPAAATVDGGRIRLTDGIAGDSLLGVTLTLARAGGSVVSLGAFGTGNGGTTGRSSEIAAGADAQIRVDGQLVRRSANTITDAMSGVTLTAMIAEPGSVSQVNVARNDDAITKAVQDLAAAYNKVRAFATANSAPGGALANNSSLRAIASSLTSQLLQPVMGTTGTFTAAVFAGLQHDRNGVLSLDASVFTAALKSNFADVRSLFTTSGVVTDAELVFLSGGAKTHPTAMPYAVEITQVATRASITGASFATYATAGSDDIMTVTDGTSGNSTSLSLADGDTIATIVQKLNAAFAADNLRVEARRTADDRIEITSAEYGTAGGFTVAYTPGSGDGTAQLGIAAGGYAGVNVAGTINGVVASGHGQVLTGASGDASDGLAVQYTGSAARSAGTVSFSLGVAGVLDRLAAQLTDGGTGSIAQHEATGRDGADALSARIADIQARLDARRAVLIQQFVAMEAAMARSQSIGSWLTSQINALQGNRS